LLLLEDSPIFDGLLQPLQGAPVFCTVTWPAPKITGLRLSSRLGSSYDPSAALVDRFKVGLRRC
jgi:hypothetical protein